MQEVAGTIFGQPVPMGNYLFAKRVAYMFPRPWEADATDEQREQAIWEALILHYESFRRNVTVSDDELEEFINRVLKSHQQPFTRRGDPAAYAEWVRQTAQEDVGLFENQMRYLRQIDKLKEQVKASLPVTVTEEEMRQEFLNEQHHVGGEFVLWDTKEEAEAFYERYRRPKSWEAAKRKDPSFCRPFSLITLEAIIDLWGVPKEQIYAFHAMEVGSVGPPMPFGRQWGVFRLLEKRTGDLADFPAQRESYRQQLTAKKQHHALMRWIDDLKAAANLTVTLPQD